MSFILKAYCTDNEQINDNMIELEQSHVFKNACCFTRETTKGSNGLSGFPISRDVEFNLNNCPIIHSSPDII